MPERLRAFAAMLARWSAGIPVPHDVAQQVTHDKEVREAKRQANVRAAGGNIAVLPLYGVITQRGNMMDDISGPGSVSTQMFAQALREAVADDSVASVLIDIDSPGGSVYGLQELAQEIFNARAAKPVVAIANSLAASAAYWLGSQASELYVTPSGEVGSIGVYAAHEDVSKALADAGITVSLITAGKYKAEGSPYAPLSDEARAFMQSRVDDYYKAFVTGVARGRGVDMGTVSLDMGQGRVLGADQARRAGMVDGVATFDEVVVQMRSKSAPPSNLQRAQRALRTL